MDRSYIMKRVEIDIYSELGLDLDSNLRSGLESDSDVESEDVMNNITELDDNVPIKSDDMAGYTIFILFIMVFILFTILMMYVISKYSTKRYASTLNDEI